MKHCYLRLNRLCIRSLRLTLNQRHFAHTSMIALIAVSYVSGFHVDLLFLALAAVVELDSDSEVSK